MNNNITGIYKITNKINNKIYIGSSVDIDKRWKQHIRELKKNKHINKHLQSAWNKYGENNFKFQIVELIQDVDELQFYEQKWINKTKCYDGNIGYNLSMDATRPVLEDNCLLTHLNCNLVYRDKVIEILQMKLEVNEKLVYYVLRDFISYPDNSILINGEVPTIVDLEPIVGLKERTIRKALKGLEDKGLVKLKRSGVRKCIFFNPYYISSGREISISTLKMFELLQCDDDKIEQYIEISKENNKLNKKENEE